MYLSKLSPSALPALVVTCKTLLRTRSTALYASQNLHACPHSIDPPGNYQVFTGATAFQSMLQWTTPYPTPLILYILRLHCCLLQGLK